MKLRDRKRERVVGEREAEPGGTEVEDKEEKGRRAGIRSEGRGRKDRRGEKAFPPHTGIFFCQRRGIVSGLLFSGFKH